MRPFVRVQLRGSLSKPRTHWTYITSLGLAFLWRPTGVSWYEWSLVPLKSRVGKDGWIQFNFRINAVAPVGYSAVFCFENSKLFNLQSLINAPGLFLPHSNQKHSLWNNDYGKFWCFYVNKQWRWCLKGGFYAHCQCHIFSFFDWKWGKVEYVHSKEQIETSWNI